MIAVGRGEALDERRSVSIAASSAATGPGVEDRRHGGVDQLVLVGEDAEDRALGDARGLGDLAGRHRPPVRASSGTVAAMIAARRSSADIGSAPPTPADVVVAAGMASTIAE